jgi:hypothetical protein
MSDQTKRTIISVVLVLVAVALSTFLGVSYPIPSVPVVGGAQAEGDTNFTNVVASGDISAGDDLTVTDEVTISDDLNVADTLNVDGDIDLDGDGFDVNITAGGSIDTDGATNLSASTGDITIDAEAGSTVIIGSEAAADSITLDANDTVTSGLNIDVGSVSGMTIDGGLLDIGGGTCGVADGDNDVCIAAVLEVDGELELDGALDADSTADFAGAVTFNSTVTLSGAVYKLTEAASAADTITAAECGKTFFMSGDDYTLTLPAVSTVSAGCEFRFIVAGAPTTSTVVLTGNTDEDVLIGGINELDVDTGNNGPYDASADTITFVGGTAVVGDFVYMICDGSYYYVSGQANADGGITITDSD